MDPREGEGFCLARATKPSSGTLIHALSHSVALPASINSLSADMDLSLALVFGTTVGVCSEWQERSCSQ